MNIKKILLMISMVIGTLFLAGWGEVSLSTDPFCNINSYVMCAEKDVSLSQYDAVSGVIPYLNATGAEKTYLFCAIYEESGQGVLKFKNGSEEGFSDLEELKDSGLLAGEDPNAKDYGDGIFRHYDENCNADEAFTQRKSDGSLDLSLYEENGVVYDVISDESNVDYFDIISGLGAYIEGAVTNKETGDIIEGVNVTLYFKNPKGTLQPYLWIESHEDGSYTTHDAVRDITTYHDSYVDIMNIPLTQYIIIARHPGYEDYISDVTIHVNGPFSYDIEMEPYGSCMPDCTFEGGTLCRKECDGINGCAFPTFNWDTSFSIKDILDLNPKNTLIDFTYDGSYTSNIGKNYSVLACEGNPYENIHSSSEAGDIICPSGKSAWKTTRVVKYQGKLVQMEITHCR